MGRICLAVTLAGRDLVTGTHAVAVTEAIAVPA
jgi:hypothetical protein